ncbi:MAG TPA: GNAT family N-acetyltransferase [Bacteroidetes bacterium]|nr:GNAT family N-acetyltransferase [Bacteroidota bacterium]
MSAETRRYPKRVKCKRDLEIKIQPLKKAHIPQLMELFRSLDRTDRAMLRSDVLDPYYQKRIARQIVDEDVNRLVAWSGDQIIASLVLHRGRARWIRHTGEVRIIVHPKFRRYGIAVILLEEVVPYARSMGVEKLYANMMPEQVAAIRLFKSIGFHREATLRDHVKDSYGRYHNMRIYSMDLEAAHKAMDDLISSFSDFSG